MHERIYLKINQVYSPDLSVFSSIQLHFFYHLDLSYIATVYTLTISRPVFRIIGMARHGFLELCFLREIFSHAKTIRLAAVR